MSKNKNVSKTIKNGSFVTIRDSDLEHGRNTKEQKKDLRIGLVIDSNSDDHIALLKRQHCLNGLDLNSYKEKKKGKYKDTKKENVKDIFNPNIKTKDKDGNPLKVDGKKIRVIKTKKYSSSEANELKRKALKEQPKNTRKPNKRRLKELKGRK